jgi:hypothetical protein
LEGIYPHVNLGTGDLPIALEAEHSPVEHSYVLPAIKSIHVLQSSKFGGGKFSRMMMLKDSSGQSGHFSQKCHDPLSSERYSIGPAMCPSGSKQAQPMTKELMRMKHAHQKA